MSDSTQQISSYLKSSGYSVTRQRQIVFDLLTGKEPQSMREICDAATDTMDRASVYRTIDLFEKIGVVRRINIGWKYKLELSDAFTEHHHHLTCLSCKKIVPINAETLETFIDSLVSKHRFKPVEHQVEIQGYCYDCSMSKIR